MECSFNVETIANTKITKPVLLFLIQCLTHLLSLFVSLFVVYTFLLPIHMLCRNLFDELSFGNFCCSGKVSYLWQEQEINGLLH